MKNLLKKILQYLLTLLGNLNRLFSFELEKSNQKWKHEQQEKQRYAFNWNMRQFMYEMAQELALALGQHSYQQLQPIYTFADIRIKDYYVRQDGIIYAFTISKKTNDTLSVSILHQLKNCMAKDIAIANDQIRAYHDYISHKNTYPFLYFGLYILSISDEGSEICIYVATHYNPSNPQYVTLFAK